MRALLLLCLAVLAVNGRSLGELGDTPAHDVEVGRPESPKFKVLNRTESYELREYTNATWAVAYGKSRFLTTFASIKAGFALVAYFRGGNTAHAKLDMTVPVVSTLLFPHHHHHPKNGSRPDPPPLGRHGRHHPPGPPAVLVSAILPKSAQGEPPLPDCPHVKLFHANTSKVYVHGFGGWAFSWTIKREIKHLFIALKDEGICPFKGRFFIAGYNGPWKIFGRYNEVWWAAKNQSESSAYGGAAIAGIDAETLFPEEFPAPEPETLAEGWPEGIKMDAVLGLSGFEADSPQAVEKLQSKQAVGIEQPAVDVSASVDHVA